MRYMKIERLHIFNDKDWKVIANQFSDFYVSVFEFITENKGSISEAREVYVTSFLYYTQLLELHGMDVAEKGEGIVYSFARCIWIKKLRKRNVDVNFVTHRREFFEMEDAFHEIDSIAERSTRTANKLAEVGEPARTLILEFVGKGHNLSEVAPRLGFTNTAKAQLQITKSLRNLIKDAEGKDLSIDDLVFQETLEYILNSKGEAKSAGVDKLNLAMVSRTVALIKNYVDRNKRLEIFKEMETHFDPELMPCQEHNQDEVKTKKMKPVAVFLAAAAVALVVSALTAFGLAEIRDSNLETKQEVVAEVAPVIDEVIAESVEIQTHTAFAISNDGYLLTTADAVGSKLHIRLTGNGSNRNLNGDVVAVDTVNNFALIKCNFEKGIRIGHRFSPDNPALGQSLFTLGFPSNELFYSKAEINASLQAKTGKINLDGFAPGSPVISDKGQIVGMITSKNEIDGLSNVTYISSLNDFVKSVSEEGKSLVKTPQRNALFYKNRIEQIDAITPYVWRVE